MRQRHLFLVLSAILLSTCIAVCSVLLLPTPAAQAHAFVIGSDPVDGSTIPTVPTTVRIFFNAPISALSIVHVYVIKNGQLIAINTAPARVSTSDNRELTTPIKASTTQSQGSYEVIWTAVADNDGHTTYGIIGFNVGYSSTGASSGTAILGPGSSNNLADIRSLNDYTSLLLIVWDWFTLSALILWAGVLMIELLLQRKREVSAELTLDSRKRSYTFQWFCLSILLCGDFILPLLRATRLTEALQQGGFSFQLWWSLLYSTNYGHIWFVRMLFILCAMGLLYRSKHIETERGIRVAWIQILLAVLIVGTYALTGDAAQVLTPHISAIIFDWLFLLAQSIWFGGFFYLGFLLLPQLIKLEHNRQSELLMAVLKQITPWLLSGSALLAISAFFLGEASISNPQQLINDPYGRILLIQSSILLGILLLSLYILCSITPTIKQQAFQHPAADTDIAAQSSRQRTLEHSVHKVQNSCKLIVGAGAGVLLCAAFLSFYAPPIVFPDIAYNNPTGQTAAASIQTQQIGSLAVTVQVLPGKSSIANTVVMTINDQHGQPVTDAQVTLATNMQIMDMGTGHATISPGNVLYSATFPHQQTFDMAGLWIIRVSIQRPGQAVVQGDVPIMITT